MTLSAEGLIVLWIWRIAVPILAVAFVPLLVSDLGPSWSARFGSGTPGTFTAVYEECRRTGRAGQSCAWRGDFSSEDGGAVRHGVVLAGADDADRAGRSAPALDTGDPYYVFPRNGGWNWLIDIVVLVLVLGVVALWGRGVWRAVTAWRRDRQAVFEE